MHHRTYLPPNQRKKFRHGLSKLSDIYWNNPRSKFTYIYTDFCDMCNVLLYMFKYIFFYFAVPSHFEYYDVDRPFLTGVMEAMQPDYTGAVSREVPNSLKYPSQVSYGHLEKHLGEDVKKLRLHSTSEWKIVKELLQKHKRVYVPTPADYNNLVQAITIQLHVPKELTSEIFRHQIAEYIVQETQFFEPKMRAYLSRKKLSFGSYVLGVYNGTIWADEFMIGAIGRMFNIRISVISPYFSEIWNIFHDGQQAADIILICNGIDFATERDNISHFTATKGNESCWECVGKAQGDKKLEYYRQFVEGKKIGLDLKSINVTSRIIKQSQEMLTNINQLCFDVNHLCLRRDQVLTDLEDIDISIGHFKRLTSYFQEEEQESATSTRIPVPKRTMEIFPSAARTIPMVRVRDPRRTEVGQQILQEVIVQGSNDAVNNEQSVHQRRSRRSLSADFDTSTSANVGLSGHRVHSPDFLVSQKTHHNVSTHSESTKNRTTDLPQVHSQNFQDKQHRCRVKVPGSRAPSLTCEPDLPSLGEYKSSIQTPEKNPYQRKVMYKSSIAKEQTVHNLEEREEGEITPDHDEEMSIDDIEDEKEVQETGVDYDITQDITMPIELQIIAEEDVITTLADDNCVAVHVSNVDDILEDLQSDTDVQEHAKLSVSLDQQIDNVLTEFNVAKGSDDMICHVLKDPTTLNISAEEEVISAKEHDNSGNISTRKVDALTEVPDRSKLNIITVQPIAYYDDLFRQPEGIKLEKNIASEEKVVKNESGYDEEVVPKNESDNDLVILSEELAPKNVKYTPRKVHEKSSVTRTIELKKVLQSKKIEVIPQPSTSDHVYSTTISRSLQSIMPSEAPQELSVHYPASAVGTKSKMAMIYRKRNRVMKETLELERVIDKSKIGEPVPLDQQLPNMFYCDKCPKSFKDKGYYRHHMTHLCEGLQNIKVIKCLHCEKCFRHQKTYRQHLQVHDGVKRYKCRKCDQMFRMEIDLRKHKALCTK